MPETFKAFSDFASSFRITQPRDCAGFEQVRLSDEAWSSAETGELCPLPEMWYLPHSTLSIDALRTKLSKWLKGLGLATDDEIVGMTLGVIAVLIEDGQDLVTAISHAKDCIKIVEVTHYHVLPALGGDGWEGNLDWQGFLFERLDSQKLIYRCRKAQAPFHEKAVQELDGAPSLKSPVFQRRLMDFAELFWRLKTPAIRRYGKDLLESYLQRSSQLHVDAMWEALEDAFLLPFAIGHHLLNLSQIRFFPESQTWTCYASLGVGGKHSWVGRRDFYLRMQIPHFDQAQRVLDRASNHFHFSELSKSTLFPLVRAVSSSVIRSSNHLSAQRIDESFLFQIIAIEQVFSEKENTTKVISNRTALIVNPMLKLEWGKAVKHVSDLYDRRSKLVHGGKSVSQENLLDAYDLANAVLRCLMRLCLRQESHQEGFHRQWLKRIDHLIAGIEAGKPPSDADLIENGIIDSLTA